MHVFASIWKFFLTHNMYDALNFFFFFLKIDHPFLKASIEGRWALPLESAASSQAWGWPRYHLGGCPAPRFLSAWDSSGASRLRNSTGLGEFCILETVHLQRKMLGRCYGCWTDGSKSQVSVIFQNVTVLLTQNEWTCSIDFFVCLFFFIYGYVNFQSSCR